MQHLAIFAALQWECRPILRHLRKARREKIGGLTTWSGEVAGARITVVKTGMGLARAAEAARALRRAHAVDVFFSSGCAGALAGDLLPGDLVIADAVQFAGDEALPVDEPQRSRALIAAQRAGLQPRLGCFLSAARVLATAEEKRAAAAGGAIAVEMESAAIARVAAEHGIAFAAARSILDPAETRLAQSGRFVDPSTGALRPGALVAHVLRHPSSVSDLLGMKTMMDAAEASLGQFFRYFLASFSR